MADIPSVTPTVAGPSAPLRGALWMVFSCACFSVMMAMVRAATVEMDPIQVAFFRNLFGLMWMLPWVLRVGFAGLRTRRLGLHVFRSVAGTGAMFSFFTAISVIPLAEVTALTFTVPLFTTIGAALLLGETVRARRWSATAVGFLGTLIVLRPGVEALSPAAMLALLAAALIAVAMLTMKALSRTESPNAIVVYMGLLMTPLSFPPALFVWQTPTDPTTWLLLLAIGLAATGGQIGLTHAFAAADASAVLPVDFIRLVFASVLGFVLFDEVPDGWTWVGAAVIISATVYIARREAQVAAGTRKDPAP